MPESNGSNKVEQIDPPEMKKLDGNLPDCSNDYNSNDHYRNTPPAEDSRLAKAFEELSLEYVSPNHDSMSTCTCTTTASPLSAQSSLLNTSNSEEETCNSRILYSRQKRSKRRLQSEWISFSPPSADLGPGSASKNAQTSRISLLQADDLLTPIQTYCGGWNEESMETCREIDHEKIDDDLFESSPIRNYLNSSIDDCNTTTSLQIDIVDINMIDLDNSESNFFSPQKPQKSNSAEQKMSHVSSQSISLPAKASTGRVRSNFQRVSHSPLPTSNANGWCASQHIEGNSNQHLSSGPGSFSHAMKLEATKRQNQLARLMRTSDLSLDEISTLENYVLS